MEEVVFDQLYDYQLEELAALRRAYSDHDCIIEGGDTGTGKTYVTAALCRAEGKRAFVICPKIVIERWFDVLGSYNVDIIGISNYEMIKNGKYYTRVGEFMTARAVACPYLYIEKTPNEVIFHWGLPDCLIIIDEAHKGKNNETLNSKLLVSLRDNLGPAGPKAIVLSATITDKVECFRPTAYLLGLSQMNMHSYKRWLAQMKMRYPGSTDAENIHRAIYPQYGSRMSIAKVKMVDAGLFKNNNIRAECIEVSPEIEQEITAAYQEIHDAIQRIRDIQQHEMHPLTAILRARQRIETLKISTLQNLCMAHINMGRDVVIFVNFNVTVTTLVNHLSDFVHNITTIVGGQSIAERTFNIEAFQSGRSRILIANIRAGGVGLSLHHINPAARPRTSLFSPPWSSIDLKQGEGRIYRAGALSDAEQIIVYCRGRVAPSGPINQNDTTFSGGGGRRMGVEELIAQAMNEKLKTIEWINEGILSENMFQL